MSNNNLTLDEERIKQLSDKSSQILLFLSFALVVVATLKDKAASAHLSALRMPMCWWSGALLPIVLAVLPLKEFCLENHRWYRIVRWIKVVLLWAALICIFTGAIYFLRAIPAEFPE